MCWGRTSATSALADLDPITAVVLGPIEGLGPGHLETVLEGLGRMTYDCRMGSGEFLSGIRKGLRSGKSLIYVAPDRNQDAAPYLSSLEERSGRRLLALYGEDV